jgi:hypothetical protein
MSLTLANITFDCRDAAAVARFWAAALDRPLGEGASEGYASLPARGAGDQQWLFLRVPEGKTAKNRMHLDLTSPDRRAEIVRLVGLGAEEVGDKDEWGFSWTVMHDPEGNEFCIADAH